MAFVLGVTMETTVKSSSGSQDYSISREMK